jgi:hypothetical protein
MLTPLEQELAVALADLQSAVASLPAAPSKPNLLPLFQRLDELTLRMPRDTDPLLLHYLHKKSYQKAALFLAGRDTENQAGNCRHV